MTSIQEVRNVSDSVWRPHKGLRSIKSAFNRSNGIPGETPGHEKADPPYHQQFVLFWKQKNFPHRGSPTLKASSCSFHFSQAWKFKSTRDRLTVDFSNLLTLLDLVRLEVIFFVCILSNARQVKLITSHLVNFSLPPGFAGPHLSVDGNADVLSS